jgi:hypothetical protein
MFTLSYRGNSFSVYLFQRILSRTVPATIDSNVVSLSCPVHWCTALRSGHPKRDQPITVDIEFDNVEAGRRMTVCP